ncbi:MAG: NAD(P)H-hydrate dehydratase, partial [Betaproteobacteria bacterium]|nr:NAD(P)H-hydrate dehydratase [Betaproteobacteria bacterium]
WDLVVDGLFGIGLERDLGGAYLEAARMVNAQSAPVLAVDIPSGLASDTGRILGTAVRAAHTVTFIGLKPGLLTRDGPDCCGTVHVRSLDLDTVAMRPPCAWLVNETILPSMLPPRLRNSHKGSFGEVGIIGGAEGMVGAALLAGRAALRIGAGRVYCGLLAADRPRVDFVQPELMLRDAPFPLEPGHASVLVCGPGLSTSPSAGDLVRRALDSALPLLLDADALNLIAHDTTLQGALAARSSPAVLTPHPAEAARLLGKHTDEIQADRVAAANTLATRFQSAAVLKGAGSVCAFADGTWYINPSGNPGMATAGMGDVLSGLIGGLLAQGADARSAVLGGVYLHGAAADACVSQGTGPAGLTASEVTEAARALFNRARGATSGGIEGNGRLDVK